MTFISSCNFCCSCMLSLFNLLKNIAEYRCLEVYPVKYFSLRRMDDSFLCGSFFSWTLRILEYERQQWITSTTEKQPVFHIYKNWHFRTRRNVLGIASKGYKASLFECIRTWLWLISWICYCDNINMSDPTVLFFATDLRCFFYYWWGRSCSKIGRLHIVFRCMKTI